MDQYSDIGITGSLDRMTVAAQGAASGMQHLLEVLGGAYDNLLLMQSAWSEWEDTAFSFRAEEISRQRKMGGITAYDEAMLWKQLMEDRDSGWKNQLAAEENYYAKLYEHSKQWISDQTRLGELSADQVAEAWQRVFDKFDNINVKYEAAANIRKALLGAADDDTAARRNDSDRWMEQQDMYDGGSYSRQVEDYGRRIASETALLAEIESGFLNGIALGAEEQKRRWLEVYEYIENLQNAQYQSAKNYLNMQVNDYINAAYEKLQQEYSLKQQQYQTELDSIDRHYDKIRRKMRENDRDEQIDELLDLKSYYANAVTKEGQDKYKSILKQIKSLESAQYQDDLSYMEQTEKDSVNSQMQNSRQQYDSAKKQIDSLKGLMLGVTGDIARESASSAVTVGNGLKNITSSITGTVETMFGSSKDNLASYVSQIMFLMSSAVSATRALPMGSNVNLTLNDYGNKNLADNNSVSNYSTELINNFNNALRSLGVK